MAIPTGAENLLYGAIVAHLAASIALIIFYLLRKSERNKHLPLLLGINAVLMILSIFIGSAYLTLERTIDIAAFLAYVIIGCYVVSIEIPGYVLLSKFDDGLAKVLEQIRKNMVKLRYDFEVLGELDSFCNSNKKSLESVAVQDIMDDFIKRCRTIKNLDGTLYDIAMKEIVEQTRDVSERSKHPFPKLIEILSLAGISFLLGQFLNHFLS